MQIDYKPQFYEKLTLHFHKNYSIYQLQSLLGPDWIRKLQALEEKEVLPATPGGLQQVGEGEEHTD